jgi:hypothetical protein
MSYGNGDKRSSNRLVAVACVALIGFAVAGLVIWWGNSKQAEYERDAYEHGAEYARDTYGPEHNACIILPTENQPNCISEANNKARDYERNEQDLVAQRASAIWAFLMGSAAIIGMVLSAFGVFLVWTTFQATREANLISKAQFFEENRPWLFIRSLEVVDLRIGRDPNRSEPIVMLGYRYVVSNGGNTPAICTISNGIIRQIFNPKKQIDVEKFRQIIVKKVSDRGTVVPPNSEIDETRWISWSVDEENDGWPDLDIQITIFAAYKAHGRGEIFDTVQGFVVRQSQEPTFKQPGLLRISDLEAGVATPIVERVWIGGIT